MFLERGANLESRAAHTHPKIPKCPPEHHSPQRFQSLNKRSDERFPWVPKDIFILSILMVREASREIVKTCKGYRPHIFTGVKPLKTFTYCSLVKRTGEGFCTLKFERRYSFFSATALVRAEIVKPKFSTIINMTIILKNYGIMDLCKTHRRSVAKPIQKMLYLRVLHQPRALRLNGTNVFVSVLSSLQQSKVKEKFANKKGRRPKKRITGSSISRVYLLFHDLSRLLCLWFAFILTN